MQKLLNTFEALEQIQIPYCILRDGDRLHEYDQGGEVDLLVPKEYLSQLEKLLRDFGFAKVPAWGHSPHHFFVACHDDPDYWIKLDVVTAIAYGNPIHALYTELADSCLKNRRRCGRVYVPCAADEFITLLLHCVLDKGYIAPHRGRRLGTLLDQIEDETYLSQLVAEYWVPNTAWDKLAEPIKNEDWQELLDQRRLVEQRLVGQQVLAVGGRHIRDRFLRKFQRLFGYIRPRTPAVALLAPDGAGKSTLARGLEQNFYFPVNLLYMGLYQNKRRTSSNKIMGLGLAQNLFTQWQRYALSRHYRAKGRLVIFDRYTYDALLPKTYGSSVMGKLRRMRRWLLAHSCPPPDLILFLDAPGELLFARKYERSPVELEAQRQQYLRLQSKLPQMVVLDASKGAKSVRHEATGLIWQKYAQQVG
ncbi:MAG: hypothetical protein R3293_13225 [Candidatus Promineifilaceae bacterium]|nr:hypothetical protein [Candidatus Promineifilaceae bacterium]